MFEAPAKIEQFVTTAVLDLMKIGILIVEDEFLLRAEAAAFMEDAGFNVYEAGDADAAIALLELHKDIQAVFTDIHMPGSMDGLRLAHYVRGRWPPVKLIITSGHARPLAEEMPTGSGFVGKPYHLEKVAGSLHAMIA
jgi:two-component system, response regulator PdtaR